MKHAGGSIPTCAVWRSFTDGLSSEVLNDVRTGSPFRAYHKILSPGCAISRIDLKGFADHALL